LGSISDISPLIDRTHSAVMAEIDNNSIKKRKDELALVLIKEIEEAKARLASSRECSSDDNDVDDLTKSCKQGNKS
jgi:hypothetical protein